MVKSALTPLSTTVLHLRNFLSLSPRSLTLYHSLFLSLFLSPFPFTGIKFFFLHPSSLARCCAVSLFSLPSLCSFFSFFRFNIVFFSGTMCSRIRYNDNLACRLKIRRARGNLIYNRRENMPPRIRPKSTRRAKVAKIVFFAPEDSEISGVRASMDRCAFANFSISPARGIE